jgi:CRISPR type I-E-associated protein CasB/Cse2
MNSTKEYIRKLVSLEPGALGLLRFHVGLGLDESVDGFDLFTGLWWPFRAKSGHPPRRAAWLIAKLYAYRPIEHSEGETLASQLGRLRPPENLEEGRRRCKFDGRFDTMLSLPLDRIEPALCWAVNLIASKDLKLDWVQLTDDLSLWERESKRLKWAKEFLDQDSRLRGNGKETHFKGGAKC